jgi:flagellar biosynthesis/type III secretory pathway protein FliH
VSEPQRFDYNMPDPDGDFVTYADYLAAVAEAEQRVYALSDERSANAYDRGLRDMGEQDYANGKSHGLLEGYEQGQRDALANQTCDDHKDNISISCAHYWKGCEDERQAAVQRVKALAHTHLPHTSGATAQFVDINEVIAAIKGES